MTSLPVVTSRQMIRALERGGFYVHHVTGSHYYMKHPAQPMLRVSVPFHSGDMKRGTVRAILRQSGITVERFVELL